MEPTVLYEKKGRVVYITLNRPHVLNAMDGDMVVQLNDAWKAFSRDDDAWVAVVCASGRAFCSGADAKALAAGWSGSVSPAMPGVGVEVWKPIIAAINGYCIGAGLVLAMLCDIRIADENASISYPEARIGSSGGIGADLTRYIPFGLAMEILLTCQPVGAQRAYEMGFINKVTPPDKLLAEVSLMAESIAENAPLVTRALKMLAHRGAHSPHYEGQAIMSQIVMPMIGSEDLKEGAQAFTEKRKPKFKGR